MSTIPIPQQLGFDEEETKVFNELTGRERRRFDAQPDNNSKIAFIQAMVEKEKSWREKSTKVLDPEYEYVYGIVTTATDWYFILHSTETIYCTSKTEYQISLTEDALKDSTELRKNVKRILEVIVGLLKDSVSASEEPAN
ncbi:3068_t:CDS:2 [Funneliformis caledonium]|uniref:3068_t:CDS:1 n=1 Tax=Funneliformis caledonium TaxID=1117310 RepID=A0A9N9INC6_9GLOM|nr:3068_t:CDS:2 [Funneliformis caledonium]